MAKTKILVIDDDVTATRMLKLGLEKTGAYEVREENCSVHGLEAARQFRPDLILLDVMMPGADGGDVASRIAADKLLKKTPIIFLTSLVSEDETGERSLLSGGYRFLAKPVSAARVRQFIDECLGSQNSPALGAA